MNNVFHNKNFCLAFLGALVSELGTIMYNFTVSFYILEISNNNAFLQGLYLALCGLALVLTTPIGGVLGDRYNKTKIMYICDYIKGCNIILSTVMLLLLNSTSSKIAVLFIMGVIGNIVSGIFTPASNSLLPHILEESQLQQANSFYAIKTAFEGIIGSVLAGLLYTVLPFNVLFFIVGICYIISAISEMLIKYDHISSSEKLTLNLALKDMTNGLDYLKDKKGLLAFLCAVLFINFFFTPINNNFIPFFIKTDLANRHFLFDNYIKPELWLSIFNSCLGISSILAAAVLSTHAQLDKCGKKSAYKICEIAIVMIALAVSYVTLVQSGKSINAFLIIFCLVCFIMGILISYVNISTNTATMRIIDRNMLSKVNSIISIGAMGMIPLANVLSGIILKELGSAILLIFCSVGLTITAFLLVTNKHIEEF